GRTEASRGVAHSTLESGPSLIGEWLRRVAENLAGRIGDVADLEPVLFELAAGVDVDGVAADVPHVRTLRDVEPTFPRRRRGQPVGCRASLPGVDDDGLRGHPPKPSDLRGRLSYAGRITPRRVHVEDER